MKDFLHGAFDDVIHWLSKIPYVWGIICSIFVISIFIKTAGFLSGEKSLGLKDKWFVYLMHALVGYFLYYWKKRYKKPRKNP